MGIKHSIMYYLAKRDHSERELKTKLRRLKDFQDKKKPRYTPEEIEEGVTWAIENKWLKPKEQLSESVARSLHNKNKGIRYINGYLSQKGLPPQSEDEEQELEKAIKLLRRKILNRTIDSNLKLKLSRFLISRGFGSAVVAKALKGVISEQSSS